MPLTVSQTGDVSVSRIASASIFMAQIMPIMFFLR